MSEITKEDEAVIEAATRLRIGKSAMGMAEYASAEIVLWEALHMRTASRKPKPSSVEPLYEITNTQRLMLETLRKQLMKLETRVERDYGIASQ